jgi:predicted RNase H-like nuclease
MPLVAGVDGCPGGWICVVRDTQTEGVSSHLFKTAEALLPQKPRPEVIAIDIPLGLTNAGQRTCDRQARGLLGGTRQRSVFPAPIRPALHAANRTAAGRVTRKADGRKVGAQSWALYPKVRELDAILSGAPTLQRRVREAHPELCFRAWGGGVAMAHPKKTREGRAERRRLIDARYGAEAVNEVRDRYRVQDVGHDDIDDAFAALWTAERIFAGAATVLPDPPPVDAVGLRMEVWY